MIKKLLILVVCVVVVAALIPSYVGAASPSEGTELTAEQQYTQAIDKLQPYLSISETGNIMLDAPKRIMKSIDSEVYESLLAGLAQTNSMIDDGYLVANPDFTVVVTEKSREAYSQYLEPDSQLVAQGSAVILSSFSGITTVVWHWWGLEVYLSHLIVIAVAGGLSLGGLIATFVPEPFASKAAAAILAFGAWLLPSFDTYGMGIIITLHWPVFVSVGPQTEPCGQLVGIVGNRATGYPLPYSTVTVKDEETQESIAEGETDSNGHYAIAVPSGTYTVTGSHDTFFPLTYHNVVVSDGVSTTRNFLLTPQFPGLPIPMAPIPVLAGAR